jgi:hypothetical protein
MRIERSRSPERAKAPDVAQELFLLEDPFGILGERDAGTPRVLRRPRFHTRLGTSARSAAHERACSVAQESA